MRINDIYIENITSLSGKHHIDLKDISKDNNLFAITGQTGSGKSSILSAISLCLYGKNYKTQLSAKDYISIGKKSANITVDFTVNGLNYSAFWKSKISKSGNISIKRGLLKDDVLLEEGPEQIIGLSYEQFRKTIILNQGQFAEFLNASFKDRKKILESLYDESLLSEISPKIRSELKETQIILEKDQAKLDVALPFSEDEIKEISKIKQEKEEKIELIKQQIKQLEIIKNTYNELNNSLEKRSEAKVKKISQKVKLEEVFEEYSSKLKSLEKNKEKHTTLSLEYKEKSPQLLELITKIEKLKTLKENLKKDQTILKERKQVRDKINNDIESKKSLIKSLEQKQKEIDITPSYLKISDEQRDIIKSNKSLIKQAINSKWHINESIKRLEENHKNITKDFNSLNNFLQENQENIKKAEDTNSITKKINSLQKECEHLKDLLLKIDISIEQNKKNEIEIKQKQAQIKELKQKQIEIENDLKIELGKKEIFELNQEKDRLNKAINLCREIVNKDSECPVCEQKTNKSYDLLEVSSKIDKYNEDRIKELERISISTNENITHIQNSIKLLTKDISQKTTSELLKEKDQVFIKLNKEKEKLSKVQEKLRDIENTEILLNEKKTAFTKIQSSLTISTQDLEKSKLDLKNAIKAEREAIETVLRILDIENEPKTETLIKDIEDYEVSFQLLTKINNEINVNQKELKIFQESFDSLNEEIELLKESIEKITHSHNSLENEINDSGITNPQHKLNEYQSKIDDLKTITDKEQNDLRAKQSQKSSLETLIRSLDEQISDYSDIASRSILHINEQALKLSKFKTEHFSKLIEFSKKLSHFDIDEDFEFIRLFIQNYINPEFENFKEKYDSIHADIVTYKTHIETFNSKKKEFDVIKVHFNKVKNIHDKISFLNSIMGKDEFRNYVLALIERNLITQANFELSKLCDARYELTSLEGTYGQEYYIIDYWNNATKRKVSTLSGGETFLVSLALALALCEMTRGKVDIESFFIDEGFGSLDEDSIEEVLEVLMQIENRGKLVGIISHVKSLTNRIPINLNVHKNVGGSSALKVVYN